MGYVLRTSNDVVRITIICEQYLCATRNAFCTRKVNAFKSRAQYQFVYYIVSTAVLERLIRVDADSIGQTQSGQTETHSHQYSCNSTFTFFLVSACICARACTFHAHTRYSFTITHRFGQFSFSRSSTNDTARHIDSVLRCACITARWIVWR